MNDFDFSKWKLDKIVLEYKLKNLQIKCVFIYYTQWQCMIYLWKNLCTVEYKNPINEMRWYESFKQLLKDVEEYLRDNFKIVE